MLAKRVTIYQLIFMGVAVVSWIVYGIDVGIPYAMNALGDAGIVQIGAPRTAEMFLSIIGLLLVMPAWIGIPIYGFYFISQIRDGGDLLSAVRTSFKEYFSTSSAAAIFIIAGSIIGIVGRTIATAIYTAGIFAVLGGLIIYLARRLFGRIETPNKRL